MSFEKGEHFLKNQIRFFILQLDLLSLTPFDLLYLIPAINYNALLRLPRLLKVQNSLFFQRKYEYMNNILAILVLRGHTKLTMLEFCYNF